VSGFAGIIRLESGGESAEVDRQAIEQMARAIAFRGPDALQQTLQPGASFAFSLLTTGPAPQESSQPCTLDGETWFLGDARCDGREELTRQLEQLGLQIADGATSEQFILHAFSKFGEAGLPELHGDFSFALWRPRQRKILAYRDLTGQRPFFYSRHSGVLIFSNTLQAVLSTPSVSRELDEEFIGDFLLGYPYHNPSRTVYRDIRRLPPGHLLEFSKTGLSVRRIANTPVEDLLVLKHDQEYIEEFQRLFTQAVRDQLPPSGATILLSGGLDSTTLAACAVALGKQASPDSVLNLRGLSVDSRPVVDDEESDIASRFAKSLGIPCQIVHSGDALPFAGWEKLPAPFPEPVLDPYSNAYLSNYRLIAKQSRVVLTGNGGDEVLRLQALPYLRFLYQRQGLLSVLSTVGRYMISQRKLPALGAGIRSRFLRLFGTKSLDPSFPPWFMPDFQRRMDLAERWKSMNASLPSPHPFNPRAYASLNDLTVASQMEFLDATWTGCALQPRHPFLDRRLSRFLLRVPLIPWAMDKYLLRRSQIGILPDEIRLRAKTPVTQDLLPLHVASGKFHPARVEPPSRFIQSLVNWPMLMSHLQQCTDVTLYSQLRPIALFQWLENVDKYGSVRYSS
jgi:asparagine synthase (glutamine-hydrolysing)